MSEERRIHQPGRREEDWTHCSDHSGQVEKVLSLGSWMRWILIITLGSVISFGSFILGKQQAQETLLAKVAAQVEDLRDRMKNVESAQDRIEDQYGLKVHGLIK